MTSALGLLPSGVAHDTFPGLRGHVRGCVGEGRRRLAHVLNEDVRGTAGSAWIAAALAATLSYS